MTSARTNVVAALPLEKYSPGVVCVGAGSCEATLIGLIAFSSTPLEGNAFFVDKLLIVLCMVATFLLYYLFSRTFSSLRGELISSLISITGAIAFAIGAYGPAQPGAFTIACNCIAAVGATALLVVWFVDLCLRPRTLPVAHVALTFAIAIIILFGEFLFEPNVRIAMQTGLWMLSSILAFTMYGHHKNIEVPPATYDVKTVDARSRIKPESNIMMAVTYCQLGIIVGISAVDPTRPTPFVLMAALATCTIMAIDSVAHKPVITERSLFCLTVPTTTASLACLYLFGSGTAHTAALCVLAIVNVLYLTLGSVALGSHITLERLSPVRTFGKMRAIHYASVLLGMGLGMAVGMTYAVDPVWAARAGILIALTYCFIGSFFHRVRTPDSTLKPSCATPTGAAQDMSQRLARCNELRERCGLSNRQYEVFCLISQGRNAEYVASALTISLSTVQTHIRNIYQKLGVHSRQEMLDLIESTKLYGED